LVMIFSNGLRGRFDLHTRHLLAENEPHLRDGAIPAACTNFKTPIAHLSDVVFCGIEQSSSNVLIWGDSHAEQLYPVLKQLQPQLLGRGVVFATAEGCQPSEHLNQATPGYSCDRFNRFTIQRAMQDDVDTVLIQFAVYWYWSSRLLCTSADGHCIGLLSPEEVRSRVFADLASTIRALQSKGKRVIIGLPFPYYDRSIPELETNAAIVRHRWMLGHPLEMDTVDVREKLQALATNTGAGLYDPRQALCPGAACIYQVDGVSLYLDNSHLVPSQAGILSQGLLKTLNSPRYPQDKSAQPPQ
jgi:hypothetical protein